MMCNYVFFFYHYKMQLRLMENFQSHIKTEKRKRKKIANDWYNWDFMVDQTHFFFLPPISTLFMSLCRLPYPVGLQHGQKRHRPSPRGLCTGQRWSLWVGMSPTHDGQRGEAPAQDGGGPAPTAIPPSDCPLLWTRVQPAGRKDQRLGRLFLYISLLDGNCKTNN